MNFIVCIIMYCIMGFFCAIIMELTANSNSNVFHYSLTISWPGNYWYLHYLMSGEIYTDLKITWGASQSPRGKRSLPPEIHSFVLSSLTQCQHWPVWPINMVEGIVCYLSHYGFPVALFFFVFFFNFCFTFIYFW